MLALKTRPFLFLQFDHPDAPYTPNELVSIIFEWANDDDWWLNEEEYPGLPALWRILEYANWLFLEILMRQTIKDPESDMFQMYTEFKASDDVSVDHSLSDFLGWIEEMYDYNSSFLYYPPPDLVDYHDDVHELFDLFQIGYMNDNVVHNPPIKEVF